MVGKLGPSDVSSAEDVDFAINKYKLLAFVLKIEELLIYLHLISRLWVQLKWLPVWCWAIP